MGTYLVPTRGKLEIEAVGERHHIDNIAKLGLIKHRELEHGQAIKTTFDIVPEPDNPYSSTGMSLSVRKNGLLLAYLPSETSRDIAKAIARITASGHVAVVEGSLWTLKARDGLKAAIRIYVSRTLSDTTLKEQEGLTLVPVADDYEVPNAYQARPEDAQPRAAKNHPEPKQMTPAQKTALKVIWKLVALVVAFPFFIVIFTPGPGLLLWIFVAVAWIFFARKIKGLFKRKK